jgi:hypothetical protein
VDREAGPLALSARRSRAAAAWPVGALLLLVQAADPIVAAPIGQTPTGQIQSPAAPPAVEWPPVSFAAPRIEQQHPELRRLRDRLLAAIRDRRVDRVRALMAPTIKDQDDDVPVDDVLASLGPLETGAPLSGEWQALEQALRLGGVLRDDVYVLPFIERDAPTWRAGTARLFVAGEGVAVRAEPDPTAALVGRVSHALLQEAVMVPARPGAAASACPDWTAVIGPGRRLAWVCTTATRPVSGLYYAFARVAGAWKLSRIYSLPE